MALFPATLESARLRYEVIRPETFDPFEMYEHVREDAPGVEAITEYLTWNPHPTPKATAEFVAHAGEQFAADEGAHYAVYPTEGDLTGESVGTTGVTVEWDRQLASFGLWLRRAAWGHGYSGERAARLFELAFDRLDLDIVAVEHHPENEQSERAITKYVERFGGRREGLLRNHTLGNDGEPYDMVRYTVSSEEWAATGDTE
jgi:RimJ/RimL family protein N-acetyltransferase